MANVTLLHHAQRLERDTAIVIKERAVTDTADAVLLADSSKSYYKERTNYGLKAWLRKDAKGAVTYGCNLDSFQVVVQNLVRERDSFASLHKIGKWQSNIFSESEKEVRVKRTFADWLLGNVWWIGAIVLVLWLLVRQFIKSKIPF